MKPYPKYKPSGIEWIGEIPEHWKVQKLKYISVLSFSNVDKKASQEEKPVLLCNYMDVYNNEFITDDFEFMEATASSEEIAKFTLKKDDVLITKDSESWDDIAVPAYVTSDLGGVLCGYHLALVRPNKNVDGRYLFRAFVSQGIADQFRVAANGITRFGVSKLAIGNSLFLVPPLEEQHAIAAYLDRKTAQIDELIADKQTLIELLKEERAALINRAVTKGINPGAEMKDSGIEWLGEIPAHWEAGKLTKYLSSIVDYRGRTPTKIDEGIFLVTARNIKNGKIDYSLSSEFIANEEYEKILKRGIPKIGDVLFTTEAPLGEVANVDKVDIALAQRIIKFDGITGRLNNYFLKYWILSYSFQTDLHQYATGSTALGIKASKLHKLYLLIPPANEQVQIIIFLDNQTAKIDEQIRTIEEEIELLQEYRTALISEAVSGKIDLRDSTYSGLQESVRLVAEKKGEYRI